MLVLIQCNKKQNVLIEHGNLISSAEKYLYRVNMVFNEKQECAFIGIGKIFKSTRGHVV